MLVLETVDSSGVVTAPVVLYPQDSPWLALQCEVNLKALQPLVTNTRVPVSGPALKIAVTLALSAI